MWYVKKHYGVILNAQRWDWGIGQGEGEAMTVVEKSFQLGEGREAERL